MSLDTTMVSIHPHFTIKDGKMDQCIALLEEILVMKRLLLTPIFKSFKKSAFFLSLNLNTCPINNAEEIKKQKQEKAIKKLYP